MEQCPGERHSGPEDQEKCKMTDSREGQNRGIASLIREQAGNCPDASLLATSYTMW